ncbi:UDP-glucose 4-epimerase [Enhygromyxa salina]|uniref:UDP-glucose 4-epimerase n=1 Tax=Enhygromyxa salina TaxID=215803 RepID=A0A0C2A4K7_9BACT|nr:NAD-dependent epimerase/dehydratase family protein [Enhygromyxa salina]KIG18313.1 UDP-glucose 4-epimerase [Enhygromyxa salina]
MTKPAIELVETQLRANPRKWLVTGAAGFIGSHLVEHLLTLGQRVVGLDNFETGTHANIEALVRSAVARGATDADDRLLVIEADVREFDAVLDACTGIDHVLHHAAIASVPRTIAEPIEGFTVNVDGSFHVLEAARQAGVRSIVHASSSAVYGDCPGEPDTGAQHEATIGRPLSPYAAHKHVAEILGQASNRTFGRASGLSVVALRYFNIIGARQDPEGAYAAVLPKWVALLAKGEQPAIFGDGLNTRDFCPVQDVVQANLLGATWAERVAPEQRERPGDPSEGVFNIGLGGRTTLLELYALVHAGMLELGAPCQGVAPRHEAPRPGDIVHSRADITRAREQLGYAPRTDMADALRSTMSWLLGRP